jgi:hypothetical protein
LRVYAGLDCAVTADGGDYTASGRFAPKLGAISVTCTPSLCLNMS